MKDFITAIGAYLRNIKPFSGEAFILLSVFSWLMSVLVVTYWVRDFLSWMGWLFLTIGVGWLTSGIQQTVLGITIYPGYWITGALVATLIYRITGNVRFAVINWPILSAMIAIIPKFLKHNISIIDPRIPDAQKYAVDRQHIVLRLLLSLILSCWLQFHFLVQDWLVSYPSLLMDDFSQSAFVVKLQVESAYSGASRGVLILNLAESTIRERLATASWSEVERWLLNVKQEIAPLKSQVMAQIPDAEEDNLWTLQAQVLSGNPDYILNLQAIWQGPSSKPDGYFAQKSCEMNQVAARTPSDRSPSGSAPLMQMVCQPAMDRIWIKPEQPPTKP